MSQPYVGEIRLVGFNFAPVGWMICNGATLSIADNSTLFNLIGTTYGGDGQQTFAIPDLQCRAPIHQGSGFVIGQKAGEETVTLTPNQMPVHTHPPQAASAGTSTPTNSPQNNVWSGWTGGQFTAQFTAQVPAVNMNAAAIGAAGGSQPHDNMPPFLVVNYIISLFGVYPSQN